METTPLIPINFFVFVKFHLDSRESVLLHDMMYVSGLKKNLVSISTLEEKGMRVAIIKEKYLAGGIPYERCVHIGIKV